MHDVIVPVKAVAKLDGVSGGDLLAVRTSGGDLANSPGSHVAVLRAELVAREAHMMLEELAKQSHKRR